MLYRYTRATARAKGFHSSSIVASQCLLTSNNRNNRTLQQRLISSKSRQQQDLQSHHTANSFTNFHPSSALSSVHSSDKRLFASSYKHITPNSLQGTCGCGSVGWVGTGQSSINFTCHCSICRGASGKTSLSAAGMVCRHGHTTRALGRIDV